MSSAQSAVATRPGEPASPAQRPWALIGLTGIAAVLAIQSAAGDWLTLQVTVSGIRDTYAEHGAGYFGAPGIGYVIGNLLLVVLLGGALWRTGRWRTWLSLAAAGVCVLLLADLALVLDRLTALEAATAAEVVRLRDTADGLPSSVGFRARTPGLFAGVAATLLFALVTALLSRPGWGIRIQAVAGAAGCAVAAAMPWTRLWVLDDLRADSDLQARAFWLWTGYDGPFLIAGAVVLAGVAYGALRAPGYARSRWALGAAVLTGMIVLSAQVIETENQVRAYDLRANVSEVLDYTSTGAAALMAVGAVLLATAAVRSWWHGREEVASPAPGDSWLPERLRDRRTGAS